MNQFTSFHINSNIKAVLNELGIQTPTAIQAEAIPILLNHDGDFVGKSATGTGKTYAYGIPLLSQIDTKKGTIQSIVLLPTRELCEQVGNELMKLANQLTDLKIESIYGGISLKAQIKKISNGTHIIVATPGRLVDLIKRKVVDLSSLKTIVFDEADEMLLKGFRTDIDQILATANRSYKTWLFSATMPEDVNEIIQQYLNNSLKQVSITSIGKTNKAIEHWVAEVSPEEKQSVLFHYLAEFKDQKGIIFCRTKSGVQKLHKQLSSAKFSCGAIHGDLPQGLRNKVMNQYKEGNITILIATDVAARGIDVEKIGYVIQYHLPDTSDSYIHRSGRTARADEKGISLTFVFPEEKDKLLNLQDDLAIDITYVSIPDEKAQLVNKAILWARKIAKEKPISSENLNKKEVHQFKSELEHLSKNELLEKMLATYLRENQ